MATQPLRLIHRPEALPIRSIEHWLNKTDQEIIKSLDPNGSDPLIVRQDGAVMNGNTRIFILRGRGFEVDNLPRKPYED